MNYQYLPLVWNLIPEFNASIYVDRKAYPLNHNSPNWALHSVSEVFPKFSIIKLLFRVSSRSQICWKLFLGKMGKYLGKKGRNVVYRVEIQKRMKNMYAWAVLGQSKSK